jgi:hypothetical protein
MIISASRRTDIPAFYSEWFINRLKEGIIFIKHPRNPQRIAHIDLSRENIDCIVFWTKNAQPMLNRLTIIDAIGIPYYFQFTITPYDRHVEKGLPPKSAILDTFKQLSDRIGKHRVVWRYDPVIVSSELSVEYHLDRFGTMCNILGSYTNQCTFSFIELYPSIRPKIKGIAEHEVTTLNRIHIGQGFSKIAKEYNLLLSTCSDEFDLSRYGIAKAACINQSLIENIIGCSIKAKKDTNQRPACRCIESIDIGAYDCCSHSCVYCYATSSETRVHANMGKHDPNSAILIGRPQGDEMVTVRKVASLKVLQSSLF